LSEQQLACKASGFLADPQDINEPQLFTNIRARKTRSPRRAMATVGIWKTKAYRAKFDCEVDPE
jgi:hypothetical protein